MNAKRGWCTMLLRRTRIVGHIRVVYIHTDVHRPASARDWPRCRWRKSCHGYPCSTFEFYVFRGVRLCVHGGKSNLGSWGGNMCIHSMRRERRSRRESTGILLGKSKRVSRRHDRDKTKSRSVFSGRVKHKFSASLPEQVVWVNITGAWM